MCGQRQHIRADLVGNIAIGGDPVRAEKDFLRLAGAQEISSHIIADDLVGNAILLQFPGRQACPLQTRTGLIHQHMDMLALFMRRADDTQRRAPIHHCQRAGIAMMDDGIAIVDQCRAMFAHAFVDLHIFIGNSLGFFQMPMLVTPPGSYRSAES